MSKPFRRFSVVTLGAVSVLFVGAQARAEALDVDWKLYGGITRAGREWCFYDSGSATQAPTGYVRVWTKCISERKLNATLGPSPLGKAIMDRSAQLAAQQYQPPILAYEEEPGLERALIVVYENAADIGRLKSNSDIYYEVDCASARIRELSVSLIANGQRKSSDATSDWMYSPPESNGARLMKMACSLKQ
jgi:hypothetical protein